LRDQISNLKVTTLEIDKCIIIIIITVYFAHKKWYNKLRQRHNLKGVFAKNERGNSHRFNFLENVLTDFKKCE